MSRYAAALGREAPTGLSVAAPNSLLSPKFSICPDLGDVALPSPLR